MKKKVAIVTKKLIVGGIEKCLIEMLDAMDLDNLDVTLFIEEEVNGIGFQKSLPQNIKVHHIFKDEKRIKDKVITALKKKEFRKIGKLIISGIKIYYYNLCYENDTCKISRHICSTLDDYSENFDLAIAYHNPISFSTVYTIDRIKADKKLMWIHSNIDEYIDAIDEYKEYYSKFDKIFAVSPGCVDKFVERYPYLKESTDVFLNRIVKKNIRRKAEEGKQVYPQSDEYVLLTTSRITLAKGIDFIPYVAKLLKDDGYKFQWYILGEGDREIITNNINKFNLTDTVHLLGNVSNPYNYYRDCDIYVQPSRFEGYVTTITEAKCFDKPIVGTNIIGINEQIIDNINGLLVDVDEISIYKGIKKLLDNPELREFLSNNLKKEEIDTTNEVQKLYNLL